MRNVRAVFISDLKALQIASQLNPTKRPVSVRGWYVRGELRGYTALIGGRNVTEQQVETLSD